MACSLRRYGTAVPSLQPHYYPMGWTATPSLAGVADALQGIYHGRVEGSRAAAQAYIAEHMSVSSSGILPYDDDAYPHFHLIAGCFSDSQEPRARGESLSGRRALFTTP